MAQFDTEYQRLEASYSDSPPGEEDLLVHVPEGSKSPWHHIENLDLFFSRISFVSPCWSCGTFRPSLSQAPNRKLGCVYPWRGMELFLRLKDIGK
ncbi:autophagy related 9A [Rhinolophus ferrumequinum]|uniref:Autophagy related 9A n=1 Tax=Rhinolophus ferrumequinum TaxID=59479 RepID=A0A7J7YGE5_RHIFE|nr:autophagy related 9A [Rhinolophus ferrumequinum]